MEPRVVGLKSFTTSLAFALDYIVIAVYMNLLKLFESLSVNSKESMVKYDVMIKG